MKGLSADDVTWSTRAEPSLWDDRDRFDQAQMDALRASEFHEIGRSGRRWSRQELLDADEQTIAAVIHDPEVRPVTDAVALARHVSTKSPRGKSDGHGRPAYLASVWRRKGAWPNVSLNQGVGISCGLRRFRACTRSCGHKPDSTRRLPLLADDRADSQAAVRHGLRPLSRS